MTDQTNSGPRDAVTVGVSDDSRGIEGVGVGHPDDGQVRRRDTGLVSELYLQHPALLLTDAIRAVPSVTVECDYVAHGSGANRYLFFRARGDDFDRFEDAIEADTTVADPLVVATHEGYRVYRVHLRREPTVVQYLAELGVRVLGTESDGCGWLLTVQLPARGALSQFKSYCEDHDITIRVDKLYRPAEVGTDLGLTEEQFRTLEIALDSGYFDVPRDVSQRELADRIGISSSAVSQRLRRALRQVLTDHVR